MSPDHHSIQQKKAFKKNCKLRGHQTTSVTHTDIVDSKVNQPRSQIIIKIMKKALEARTFNCMNKSIQTVIY